MLIKEKHSKKKEEKKKKENTIIIRIIKRDKVKVQKYAFGNASES